MKRNRINYWNRGLRRLLGYWILAMGVLGGTIGVRAVGLIIVIEDIEFEPNSG